MNNLSWLLKADGRFNEALQLSLKSLMIRLQFNQQSGHDHPNLLAAAKSSWALLMEMGDTKDEARDKINAILEPYGMSV
jgi:hypothetical protein